MRRSPELLTAGHGRLVTAWRKWAEYNRTLVARRRRSGDVYGAVLAAARGQVRAAAAELLRQTSDPMDAAKVMHAKAVLLSQRDMPLVGCDDSGLDYTRARVWQDCARALDPCLPEVQARWE